ncbi:protein kinase [Nocardioides sp. MH1]|uniref:protein kinase domain-containing protein n=1 Tax=Nocardioides sp. MH1 TaxID=3242490 RepID=UPI00352005D0
MPTLRKAAIWGPVLRSTGLGPYTVGDCVGEGCFCMVFEGHAPPSADTVALKVLEPVNAGLEDQFDFKNEGILLRKLVKSRAVVDIFESRVDVVPLQTPQGISVPVEVHAHVLEYADGALEELLEDDVMREEWDWSERLSHWRACVLGIHEMHLKRVVHRDLKSSNCLVFLGNADVPCKVSDLGRSRDLDKLAHVPAQDYLRGRGDLRFAPPELLWLTGEPANAAAFKAADVYALGSLLFELGTGQGISAAALPTPAEALREALADRAAGVSRDLAALRPRYEIPLSHFREACPPAIRNEATELIRLLCDPVPSERQPKILGHRKSNGPGLTWLLRRADILERRLKHNARRSPHRPAGS